MTKTTTTLGAITPGEDASKADDRITAERINNHFAKLKMEEEKEREHRKVRADAVVVYDKTGKLPSQLLQERDELVGALRNAIRILDEDMDYRPDDVAAGEFADIKLILSKYPKP